MAAIWLACLASYPHPACTGGQSEVGGDYGAKNTRRPDIATSGRKPPPRPQMQLSPHRNNNSSAEAWLRGSTNNLLLTCSDHSDAAVVLHDGSVLTSDGLDVDGGFTAAWPRRAWPSSLADPAVRLAISICSPPQFLMGPPGRIIGGRLASVSGWFCEVCRADQPPGADWRRLLAGAGRSRLFHLSYPAAGLFPGYCSGHQYRAGVDLNVAHPAFGAVTRQPANSAASARTSALCATGT